MATAKQRFPKTDEFGALSNKLVRHYGLPHGSRFALRRKSRSTSSRPFMRSDVEVRRKLFRREEHPNDDSVTTTQMCRAVEAMLYPNHGNGGVVIIRPDGEVADGKTHLRTLRALPARPTQEERNAAESERQSVQEICSATIPVLRELEEAIEEPEKVVTQGVLVALENRYGVSALKEAIKKLRL